jgi:hypothetical protein
MKNLKTRFFFETPMALYIPISFILLISDERIMKNMHTLISAKITGADGEAISPVDRITLDDFKVTVSGKYIDEF